MKKLIATLIIAVMAFTSVNAQHSVPRFTHGTLNQPAYYYSIKDTAGANDTTFIKPTAYRNVYNINVNDTLKGYYTVVLNDTVRSKVSNVRSLSYEDDNMIFYFKSGRTIADTVYFYGYIGFSTSSSTAPFHKFTMAVPALRQGYIEFHFNGTAWIAETVYLIAYSVGS